jgi:hypothetical protein
MTQDFGELMAEAMAAAGLAPVTQCWRPVLACLPWLRA